MFRSKKDVDRHVQNVFCKLRNENEKNLRCYNVAKLYYQVGDYESTKRYVFNYLEIRDSSASAHKLLGQAYEALGQKEAAFNEYKISLELEGRQDDLVLKICELLVDMDIGMDVTKLKYWIERADKLFPHNPIIFQLKEKLLTIEKPNNSSEDLEALIASELAARPTDVQLRIKLLNYYMSEHRLDKAYEHAISVEATVPHKDNVVWYQLLYELLTKYKETKSLDWSFWLFYISVSDKYVRLCLKEQGGQTKKSIQEAAQAVFNFDQNLNEMKSKNFSKQHTFTEHLFTHMWGQLHFHLACLLLRKTKREQGSWNEAGRLCSPLLLTALHVAPLENRIRIQLEDEFKNQFNMWAMEAAYRCCQAGYILQNYARDDTKKLMDRIDKFCTGLWRERIYQRIFVTRIHLDHIRNSFFCHHHSAPDPPLRMCTANQLRTYSQIAQEVWPDSLHHQIWLGMENRPQNKDAPYPDQTSHVFPALQFSVFNTNQAAPDSLCLIDIDAFLNASIFCSSAVLEEQQLGSFVNPEKLPTLPIDLTTTLSTSNQEKWWSAAYKMYSKREDVDGDIGELRQELQQGLGIIRCIGNHGMHPVLLVHLARMFHYRAKMMKEKDEANGYIPRWEARSELYWTAALPLLERIQNNQTLRISSSKLFNYQGKEMNNFELTNALEEGKLLLAQRLVRDKQYEQAIDALQALKCPEASFQLAQIYKIFADEIVDSTPRESLTSEMRSQHIIMLSKARNCFYLTLDRLRSPGTNPKHPLNSELGTHITDIENELKRIDPDLGRGDLSRNDIDGISDESYSPTHSAVDQAVTNPTLPMLTTLTGSNMLSTPQRNIHRTPKHASTPCRLQDYLNLSKNRTEARPSPERLDAQIRQIMQSRDNEIQEMMEQMKNMMTQMKTLTEKMDNLTKEVVESRKENQKHQQQQQQQQRVQQQQNINPAVDPEDFYVLDDDEYVDLNYQNQPTGPASSISGNIFTPQHARHPYSSLMYPSAATAFQYYQGGLPFPDPNTQAAISSLYPHTVYPMPMLYPNQTKVPDNPLQQGLFASTLSSQLPDLMSATATNPSLQMSLKQKIETPSRTKPEATTMTATTTTTTTTTTIIKDALVNKALPVNVVITTSDTLPTTVPSTQPTLSVTIPPQYRLGGGVAVTFSTTPIMTMTMTTTKSSSSNVPHCYQIPMPLQATIPTTVNLPSTSTYVTPANINVPPIYVNLTTSSSIVTVTHTTSTSTLQNAHNNANSSKIHDKTDNTYESIESPNTSTEVCEQEHDPIPNFIPVIPLPAKVKVTTGEENEDTLYCGRAKLFRFVDKEWKERGVGDVKLLRNTEGKVRLLMRRDQILKICANHMLRPDMELSPMTNNNKAWFWVANDFADEEVKLEKFCIRFKTAEEAMTFKEAFDQARFNLSAISPEKVYKISEKVFTSSSNKDSFKTQKSQLTQQDKISSTTEVIFSDKSKSSTTTLGGFSFSSKPIIQEVSDMKADDFKKIDEPSKVSPFSGFSFTKSTNTSETKITTTTATSAISMPSASFILATISTTNSQSTVVNTTSNESPMFASSTTTGQNSTTLRRPRLPPPGVIKQGSSNDEIRPQTENEHKLFVGPASLQCQSVNGTNAMQWKNKGTGSMMLLLNAKSGKLRLLLTDDESSKIYSYGIPSDMAFTYKNGTTVVNWTIPGNVKEPGKTWTLYAATFNTSELASQFYNAVSSCQQKLAKGSNPNEVAKALEKKVQMSGENNNQNITEAKPSLSELFKPPIGSWECTSCYTRNNSTDMKCLACEAPSSSTMSNKNVSAVVSKPVDSKLPLSELFKSPIGSWTCTGCYILNSGTNAYCIACDSSKDPSQPPKPQQANIFQMNASSSGIMPMTTFSFGIPKNTTKETTVTGFSFRMSQDKSASESVKTPSKSEETIANFMFGMPVKSSTTLNTGDSPFTFGSPAKSFGFNFMAKSPTKSPGGGGEISEDEVVESEDVHFSPVIPLPDKVEVKTGEEDEEMLYSHRAKLFRFDTTVKEWKERGLGDIKLLCHKETGKLRLIMRRDHVLKLCLNHILSNELEFTSKDEKTWLWTTADYSEGEIEYMQFACRFKTSEIAADFKKAIDDARKNIKPATISSSEKINKSMTKTVTKTISSPVKEIEIVYEAKVTPEEKAAALKLQLPVNFYSYKQKENCPGCRGCRKPSIVLYPDTAGQDTMKFMPEEKKMTTQSKDISSLSISSLSDPESTSEITRNVTQSASVKNGFSFATSTATFKSSAIPNIDSSTMSFGTGDLKLFNDKKTMTFSFGMNPQFDTNETMEKTTAMMTSSVSLENLKVCSASNAQTTQTTVFNATNTVGKSPIFSQAASTASIFKPSTFSFNSDTNIFGGASKTSSKTSSFNKDSGNSSVSSSIATVAITNFVPKTSTVITTSSIASNQSSNSVFGVNSTPFSKMTLGSNSVLPFSDSITTTNIFGGMTATTTNLFGGTTAPATTNIFGGTTVPTTDFFSRTMTPITTNIFGGTTAATNATNVFSATATVFGTKPLDDVQKNEDGPSFLLANNMSFSALAATAVQPEAFKVDPNFTFAGAGSSVFGSKSSTSLNSSMTIRNTSREEQKEENDEDDGEVDSNEQEHDPHFEPIVPLPDTIEVRTGEEDEEKVFCQRAKLYRYDNATKEWKERGVGEMKILHHVGHGSYRLLLRREQVHKVVCNFLITPDVEFHPLSTSNQAWMWAGMNYAEQEPCAEQLAVKFKSPDLARQFKAHVDNIQQELREKRIAEGERCIGEAENNEDRGHDVDEEEEEDDEDEEEDEEDDQEMLPIIEKRATVFARWPDNNKWESVGLGNLAIHYDSEIYAERIVLKLDDSEDYASNTIISIDTVMRVEGKECIWSGIDYALDPPERRVLRAVFSSIQAAQQMHTFFEDGVDSAKQAGVVEYHEEE
ncbi:PREDICTED: E3 SUMO-protein ligase RanBP2-like [Atta cephalotes]|uniref:E3 SUMO-protein ligase RanBP2 n=1 Tax=Atta cephalotes TaxID=12957 RepID=A0A158NQB3_ATTCE|nr:PREDICTED: E3 SUMO-protein ligase RanBP2-like [Atta cephalotes]